MCLSYEPRVVLAFGQRQEQARPSSLCWGWRPYSVGSTLADAADAADEWDGF